MTQLSDPSFCGWLVSELHCYEDIGVAWLMFNILILAAAGIVILGEVLRRKQPISKMQFILTGIFFAGSSILIFAFQYYVTLFFVLIGSLMVLSHYVEKTRPAIISGKK